MTTKRVILDLVTIQRRVALSHGAAFWSTFDAMGGEGSMARWVKAQPQLGGGDLTHPTPLGAEVHRRHAERRARDGLRGEQEALKARHRFFSAASG